MAKQGFGLQHYGSSSRTGGASQTLAAALSSYHDEVFNRYLPSSVPPVDRPSSGALAGDDPDYYPYPYNSSWPSSSPVQEPLFPSSLKRSSRVIYPQTMYGSHNSLGQTDAWYSGNPLAKRPKFASVSDFPSYPQRPGEKDCAHYMLTRTCKFGDSCKFDHPLWVPDGGIPDWKEVVNISTNFALPERLGQPDCSYYLKTQTCKYGSNCKFNHPKDMISNFSLLSSAFPEQPTEPLCTFYVKTGKCKFGALCRFHHPKNIKLGSVDLIDNNEEQPLPDVGSFKSSPHNSKGLPLRQGEVDCPFYIKTGSCKYGSNCRYNHPNKNELSAATATLDFAALASLAATYNTRYMDQTPVYNTRPIDPVSSLYKALGPIVGRPTVVSKYPQRAGQIECDVGAASALYFFCSFTLFLCVQYYMKTGECRFGERCKFHHPADRFVPVARETQRSSVKLTLAGLPRREDAGRCPFYMKTGACKYGANCKFDHPPPGEVISDALTQSVGFEDQTQGETFLMISQLQNKHNSQLLPTYQL